MAIVQQPFTQVLAKKTGTTCNQNTFDTVIMAHLHIAMSQGISNTLLVNIKSYKQVRTLRLITRFVKSLQKTP